MSEKHLTDFYESHKDLISLTKSQILARLSPHNLKVKIMNFCYQMGTKINFKFILKIIKLCYTRREEKRKQEYKYLRFHY